eukprot:3986410-Prymnesium_polylepis.1
MANPVRKPRIFHVLGLSKKPKAGWAGVPAFQRSSDPAMQIRPRTIYRFKPRRAGALIARADRSLV